MQTAADPLALVGARAKTHSPDATIIATDDCPEMTPGLFVLALPASTTEAGLADSYLKRCTPKPGSVAALGRPVVDPSFAALREEPASFGGSDIVTRLKAGLLVKPHLVTDPEDPREGLRVAVEDAVGPRRTIAVDCIGAEVARSADAVALACATERVVDQLVYRLTVYRDDNLTELRRVERCRAPRFTGATLQCTAQAIDADGRVTALGPRAVPLR